MRLPGPRLMGPRGAAMELFTKLFSDLLVFVYHCFDRVVIHGYLSGLSRPEQVVHFFRQVVGAPVVSKEALSERTADYQNWVEAFARNHNTPIEWAEKGVRKEDYVQPWLRKMLRKNAYGVYFIFKSMEQGPSFRVTVPKFPTKDPAHRPRPVIRVVATVLLAAHGSTAPNSRVRAPRNRLLTPLDMLPVAARQREERRDRESLDQTGPGCSRRTC